MSSLDEAQDMSEGVFRLLRAMIPPSSAGNDLFIVGDPHQRIYGHKVVLSHCGIEIRGRSRKLRINYRTTEQIRKWATEILAGIDFDDLNGDSDNLKDYRSMLNGDFPIIKGFNSFEDEVQFLATKITEISAKISLSSMCLVLRTNELVERYCQALQQYDLPTRKISRSQPDNQTLLGLRVATMHRVKGLQFEFVFLASMNHNIVPLPVILQQTCDPTAKQNILTQERSLVHVAATRAKQAVVITYYDQPSPFLP